MNAKQAIRFNIDMSAQVTQAYLADLDDKDLLHRPAPGGNHINWQLGHLIAAEHLLMEQALPGVMPPLPEGFLKKYAGETAASDDPRSFCTKSELLAAYQQQRAGTLAALEKVSDAELDRELQGWTPSVGATFSGAAGGHWLMHLGQWAVVRRQLGRKPLF